MKHIKYISLVLLFILCTIFSFGCSSPPNTPTLIYHGNITGIIKSKESWILKQYIVVTTSNESIIELDNDPTILLLDVNGMAQLPYIQWENVNNHYIPNRPIIGEYYIYHQGGIINYIFSPIKVINWNNQLIDEFTNGDKK